MTTAFELEIAANRKIVEQLKLKASIMSAESPFTDVVRKATQAAWLDVLRIIEDVQEHTM